jgi:hypothetical protein
MSTLVPVQGNGARNAAEQFEALLCGARELIVVPQIEHFLS